MRHPWLSVHRGSIRGQGPAATGGCRLLRAAVASLTLVVGAGCGPDAVELRARDPRPNILLISLDTTRADHLSAYGYDRPTSARLDALAEEGVRFAHAYAPSATTGPSHATLFTGLSPLAHGVRKNGHVLADTHDTLAERLADHGYETGAVVSSYVLSERFGYDQGFGVFDDDFSNAETPEGTTVWEGEQITGRFYGRADDTTDRALTWLTDRAEPEKPFLLFVHYYDPHDPYVPPDDWAPPFSPGPKEQLKLNRTIFLYDMLIAYMDQEIGRLLDGLDARGLREDTIVVVTGDHGEGLMSRGHMYHGVHIYDEGVRVPLIVRWPGQVAAGAVVEVPVAVAGVGPTLLELAGGTASGALARGAFVDRLQSGGEQRAAEPVFLFRRHYAGTEELGGGLVAKGEKYGVREGRWKLIEGPEEGTLELYDLERDPGEVRDLSAEEPEVVARLRAAIAGWIERDGVVPGEVAPVDEAARARLRALGYVE